MPPEQAPHTGPLPGPLPGPVLGFDTSAAHCAAALVSEGRILAQVHRDMPRGQGEALFPLLESLLDQAGLDWSALAAIGCGVGPGNFTGIRISVAAARGLALARGIPAIGVSAFQMLALGASGPALTLVDARQERLHVALIEPRAQDAPAPLTVTLDALRDALPKRPALCIGHRADEVAARLDLPRADPRHPPAVAVALIAAARLAAATGTAATETRLPPPAPLYLRPADAAPAADPPPPILP